jgi:hypothetical protein
MLSFSAFAQNAVVSGRITDTQDAVIVGASVELLNRATGVRTVTTANGEGYYVAPPLAPGVYDVTISSTGFSQAKFDAVTLEVGQTRTLNAQLTIGATQDSVTISDTAPLLTTNRADRGTVIENKFVTSIPLNLRNPLLLLTLAPGVSSGLNAGINTASQSTTNNFRINGGRGGTNEILIDGAANTGTYNNQVSAIPQVDALQEFKVNTSPYAAEFGRTGGGVVSFAIRSGTNDLHGSATEFLRNSVLDANGFNANRAGQAKPSFKRNQFGFTLGGPVLIPKIYNGRNRTFFFVAYEGLRERSLSSFTGTVPTALERTGDFSKSLDASGKLIQIYDPRTTRLDPNRPAGTTRYIRDTFAGNVIPTTQMLPLAGNLFKYYPLPNQPGQGFSNTNNYYVAAANSIDANRTDARIDHQISPHHQIFGRYDWFSNLNAQPLVFGNFASPVQTPNRIPGTNWTINHIWTISPSTILDHHFSLAQSETNRIPLSLGFDQTTLGLPKSVTDGQRVAFFPQVSVGGLTGLGPQGTASNVVVSKTMQYAASVTMLRGSHTMKAGVDWRRFPVRIDNSPALSLSSSGSFTGGPNPQAATASTGAGLADLLLGIVSVSYQVRPVEEHVHDYYAGYFQDEFKVSKALTLTLGLRYNLETPRTEANNEYVFLDLDSPSPLAKQVPGFPNLKGGVGFVGVNGVGRQTQIAQKTNFDPRIGLSWQINSNTVLRSGFGIFHHPLVPNTDLAQGFNRTTTSLVAAADGVTPLFNLNNPFPDGILQPTGNQLGLNTLLGQTISGPLRKQRLPYQSQWSIDVQRQLPWSLLVEVGYAGTSAVALPSAVNYNQLPDALLAQSTALLQTVPNPFFGIITDSTSTLSRSTVQAGQLLRPFPQFTGMSASQAPVGHSSYNALQLKVERRFSQGLAVLFAYTHSKTIDNTSEFGGFLGAAPGFQNNNCFSCDRSLSYQHIPDVARISYRYELPFGVGKARLNHGILARVLGGWALAGFISADNGTPVSVTSPNDSNSFGGGSGMRPNATGQKASLDGGHQYVDGALYFNPAAFSRTPQFSFGNVSRTLPDVRNPGTVNWDALIEKRFSITERIGLDFRTELYNALNQINFGGPVASITSADFGKIRLNQVNTPRQIQFGMRLSF